MRPSRNPYATSWDLRVACALISLDLIDPFLSELGFDRDNIAAARDAARKFLVGWHASASEEIDPWLNSVRNEYGDSVAERMAELVDALAHPGPIHLSWIELMVKIRGGIGSRWEADLPPNILEWFRAAAGTYLAGSDQIHQRVDELVAPITEWDITLLTQDFYPGDTDEDPDSRRFDPGSWLWAYLDKLHWERFRERLRSHLTPEELNHLVAWGDEVIATKRWPLSSSL